MMQNSLQSFNEKMRKFTTIFMSNSDTVDLLLPLLIYNEDYLLSLG